MANPLEIPIPSDTPLFSQRIALDGQEYLLQFDWNDREQRWYMSLLDIDEKPLAMGMKIVANVPILRRFTLPSLPPGDLIAIDLSNQFGEPPTYTELGIRVRLFYFPVGP